MGFLGRCYGAICQGGFCTCGSLGEEAAASWLVGAEGFFFRDSWVQRTSGKNEKMAEMDNADWRDALWANTYSAKDNYIYNIYIYTYIYISIYIYIYCKGTFVRHEHHCSRLDRSYSHHLTPNSTGYWIWENWRNFLKLPICSRTLPSYCPKISSLN